MFNRVDVNLVRNKIANLAFHETNLLFFETDKTPLFYWKLLGLVKYDVPKPKQIYPKKIKRVSARLAHRSWGFQSVNYLEIIFQ